MTGHDARGAPTRMLDYAYLDARREQIREILLRIAPRAGDEFHTDQVWEPFGLVADQHRRILGRYLRYARHDLPCLWLDYAPPRGSRWRRV
jgi:hypothetical protein